MSANIKRMRLWGSLCLCLCVAAGATEQPGQVAAATTGPQVALQANPDAYNLSLDENGCLAPTVLDVMANDAGNGIYMASWRTSNFPGNISWDRVNNYFVYTVPQPYRGSAFTWSIDYTIRDLNGEPASTTATISVVNNNLPALQAVDDTFRYAVATDAVNFQRDLNVLANDVGAAKYIASYTTTTDRFKGSLVIGPDGQYLTYRLPGQYDGTRFTSSFTYVVRDGSGASAEARVSVRIAPGSRPSAGLKATPDSFRLLVDANHVLPRTTLDVLANDAGDGLRITLFKTSDTYCGVLSLDSSSRSFVYAVAELKGASCSWWFDYTVVDSSGRTATARASVRVDAGPQPLPAVLRDDTFNISTTVGSVFITKFKVLQNDDALPGLRLVGYEYMQPAYGTLTVRPQYLLYKLNTQKGFLAGTRVTDKFRYIAKRGSGQAEYKAVITINVVVT